MFQLKLLRRPRAGVDALRSLELGDPWTTDVDGRRMRVRPVSDGSWPGCMTAPDLRVAGVDGGGRR